jgi:hypothetical protein
MIIDRTKERKPKGRCAVSFLYPVPEWVTQARPHFKIAGRFDPFSAVSVPFSASFFAR